MKSHFIFGSRLLGLIMLIAASVCLQAAPPALDEARERQIRQRYEQVLLKNPFQDRAFNQVYESYLNFDGVDRWIESLKPAAEATDAIGPLLVLGQIFDRQFKTPEAIESFEQAAEKGEARPQFKVLLGTLYYKVGRDDKAAELLGSALDTLTDLDQRSSVCRMLGNLYLRQGKRDEAIRVWKRILEQNPQEVFSQIELAEIYEDNRMWDEAIAIYRQVVAHSQDDPYRRCRALRSIGHCYLQAEKFKEAIATYEEALGLVSPGNWLFDDLKMRLVGVYEDMGDLAGLAKYIQAKLEQTPADLEFRDLLAETYKRMAKLDLAEIEYRYILERNPKNPGIHEKLIALYTRMEKNDELAAQFEKLIELFPAETDYLRRFGEFYLRSGKPEKAKEIWQRLVKERSTPERLAELAGWYESYEFSDDAIPIYEQAIQQNKNKEWVFRLAHLKFQKGDESGAIQLWKSVLNAETSKPEDYAEVASILEANQKLDEAAELRKVSVEKAPDHLELRLAYARNLVRQKKFELALAEFDRLAEQNENEYFQSQGEAGRLDAYAELGLLEEKQKEWERDLERDPTSVGLLSRLARLYERAGQRERAIRLYERRRDLDPQNAEHQRSLASAYKAAKQTEQAIELLKGLVETDKNRARSYYKDLLDIYLALDSKDEAIAAAEKMVSLVPSDPEARLDLAQTYTLYRQPEKAFDQYRYALRLEPNEPDYYRQYGEALAGEKRWGEAQAAFRKMLDVAKEDHTRLNAAQNLARIYMQQEQLNELISEFSRRIRNTPKKLSAYEELAAIYREAGQAFRSIEILENGLENADDKVPALKTLIRASYEAQDFAKTRLYFERLIALSAKPSSYEYERLGSIYAQMGELEKAKEIWNKIVSDAPNDSKAFDRLATILRNEGFTEEAVAMKAKAVELDPFNHKLRFDYAQLLASAEQPVQAIEQLQAILDIGEQEQKAEEKKEKTVQRLTRGQSSMPGGIQPYMFVYGLRGGMSYYSGPLQGGYKQFKPNVISFMASLAQRSIGEEAFLATFEERAKKNPNDTELKRNLLLIYQAYNRIEDALKLAEQILEAAPDDVDLLQQIALYHTTRQKLDKAIPLMEKLAQSQPRYRTQVLEGLIPLYMQNKQQDKATELMNQLLAEDTNNIQVVFTMGNLLQQQGKIELVKALYEKALTIDPRYRNNLLLNLANLHRQTGKAQDALPLYKEILLAETPNFGYGAPARRQVAIYSPRPGPQRNYGGPGRLRNIPPNVIGYLDYMKSEALGQIQTLSKTNESPVSGSVFDELEKIARSYKRTQSAADRNRSWETAKLLAIGYISENKFDQANDLLQSLRRNGIDDVEWFNLSIYLEQQRENYPAMIALYDQLQGLFPAKSREILIAKSAAAILNRKYEDAASVIRELNQQRLPPRQFIPIIQPLVQAGEKKLLKQLLEEHLASISRNSEVLAMLAKLAAEENDYDRAIALANEAWERKTHSRSTSQYMYGLSSGFYYFGGPHGMSGPGDNLLRELHSYYVAAGKSNELVEKFKSRLEKQPSSVQAHQDLAELYSLNQERDKALDVYQQLAEKRPHLIQTKMTIANIWTEKGDLNKAIQIYEELLKTNPTAYQQISWQLRHLYQRIGKGKDLVQMEEKMAKKATNPNQIRQLADQFLRSGELEKAEELFRKAMTLSPADSWIKRQLAELMIKKGKMDEALDLFREWLDAPSTRVQGWVDHHTIKQMVGFFKAAGRLDELKKWTKTELEKNSTDRIAKGIEAHIAVQERRFDDAVQYYITLISSGQDPNAINELLELTEIRGDYQQVLDALEKLGQLQNFWDHQRLARLHIAVGNKAKAVEAINQWVEQQSQFGGGSYYIQEGFRLYSDLGLWDDAEKFIRKHRKGNFDQDYVRQELDNRIADFYVTQQRFTNLVEEVLNAETVRGRDLDLIRAIANRYQQSNQPEQQRELLEKLIAKDPKNRDLSYELARLHIASHDHSKALPLLERLVSEDPNKDSYRESHADVLVHLGRSAEALDSLAQWAAEKPLEQRFRLLANFYARFGQFQKAREAWSKAVDAADPSKKLDAKLALAEFEAAQGNITAARAALDENFRTRRDAAAFDRYVQFLRAKGLIDEAHRLFVEHKDAGFFDRYRNNDLVNICFDAGDARTPMDLSWQFTRYTQVHNYDYHFSQTLDQFRTRAKVPLFLDDFQRRLHSETNLNYAMLEHLGDGYGAAGWTDHAASIYDQILQRNRFDHQVGFKKAQLLSRAKRPDEAIAVIKSLRPFNLHEEIQDQLELIRIYMAAERKTEADQTASNLLAWAKGGNTHRQLAEIYFEAKEYEKALPLFEKSSSMERHYDFAAVLLNYGKCLAKLGKSEQSLKTWEEMNTQNNGRYLSEGLSAWLIEEGLLDLARQLIEKNLSGADPNRYATAALIAHRSKNLDAAFAAFEQGYQTCSKPQRSHLLHRWAAFINEHNLLDHAAQRSRSNPDSPLRLALLRAYAHHRDAPGRLDLLVPVLLDIKPDDRALLLELAEALIHGKRPDEAYQLLKSLLAEADADAKLQIAAGLAKLDRTDESRPLFQELLKSKPHLFLNHTPWLESFAKSASDEDSHALITTFNRLCLYPSHAQANAALLALYRGQTNQALTQIAALTQAQHLSASHLQALADGSKKLEQTDHALQFLQRLAQEGYGSEVRWQALSEIVQIHARRGNIRGALAAYAEMFPVYRRLLGETAADAIAEAVTSENFAAFKQILNDIITQNPRHDRVSALLGLSIELSEKLRLPDPSDELIGAFNLDEIEKAEASAWAALIEDWEVAGPFDSPSSTSSTHTHFSRYSPFALPPTSASMDAPLPPETEFLRGSTNANVTWKPVDGSQMLGFVRFNKALGLDEVKSQQKIAYARTRLVSPDDRQVVLSLGSDDWVKLWVNDREVHAWGAARSAYPDQDRIVVRLKKGDNKILVKVGNVTDAWAFCLRIAEGGDGVVAGIHPAKKLSSTR